MTSFDMFSFVRSSFVRSFSSSVRILDRAVVYSQNGDPSKVLRVFTYPSLPAPPPPNSVNINFLLSPIHPADINVVEGVYPSKPRITDALALSSTSGEGNPVFIGGNEGLARVTAVGEGVHSLAVDDWVIMTKQQAGTWATDRNVTVADVAKVPDSQFLTESQAATMTVSGFYGVLT
jgi:trans-2-enoyl-CoA reductase